MKFSDEKIEKFKLFIKILRKKLISAGKMCAKFNYSVFDPNIDGTLSIAWQWRKYNNHDIELIFPILFIFFFCGFRWTLLLTKSVAWWTKSEIFVICPSLLTSITENQLWPIRWCQRLVSLPVLKLVKLVSPTPAKMNKNVVLPSNQRKLAALHAFTISPSLILSPKKIQENNITSISKL